MKENNPVSTPVVTSQVAVEQPKQSSFLVILLSVLLLLAVSIAGFFAYQTQKLVKELQGIRNEELVTTKTTPEPTTEPVATDSSEVDPTANWKAYTDKNGKFSFKYPSSLLLKVFDNNSLILSVNDGPDRIYHEFRVNQYVIPEGKTLYQFVYDGGVGDNYGKNYLESNRVSLTFKDSTINSSYKVLEPSEWPSGNGTFIKFLQNKNMLIWFSLEPYNSGGTPIPYEKENIAIYNQILSTFKFTN